MLIGDKYKNVLNFTFHTFYVFLTRFEYFAFMLLKNMRKLTEKESKVTITESRNSVYTI